MTKRACLILLAASLWVPVSLGIPNVFIGGQFIGPIVPAHPRFNANLTPEFLTLKNWEENEFPGPWENDTAIGSETVKRMTALPVLFGAVPDSVVAYGEKDRLREMVITYLDAGAYFGFKMGGEKTHADRETGKERRSKFDHHYRMLSRDLRDRLEKGCGPGRQSAMGRSDLLRTVFTEYQWEDFVIRLARREGHSVVLQLMRSEDADAGFVDRELAGMRSAERNDLLAGNVHSNERGDRVIDGIPMLTQGYTPFCGIHTLAMAGNYYGLRLRADELAAGAEFRNTGSARGSRILELYHAAGEELGMKVSVSSRFDFDRVTRAVEAGRPVIVWRRVSKAREEAHSRFAAKLTEDQFAALPAPTKSSQSAWPERSKKGSPSHASIVSGFNRERNEVIFTDPWGEEARDRRMRLEEMEATTYAVFFFGN